MTAVATSRCGSKSSTSYDRWPSVVVPGVFWHKRSSIATVSGHDDGAGGISQFAEETVGPRPCRPYTPRPQQGARRVRDRVGHVRTAVGPADPSQVGGVWFHQMTQSFLAVVAFHGSLHQAEERTTPSATMSLKHGVTRKMEWNVGGRGRHLNKEGQCNS